MITIPVPDPVPATDAPIATTAPLAPPPEEAGPGRDLALFVVLLVATDVSGLLHIYGLSWLYGQATFLGLGWLMVAVAVLLLILPAQARPTWLRFPLRRAGDGLVLLAVSVPVTLAATFLFSALSNPPAWVARDPHRDTSLLGTLLMVIAQLAALAMVPALAGAVAYARHPATRRAWAAALAVGAAVCSLVDLLYVAHLGKRAPDTWAILLGLGTPTTLALGGCFMAIGGLVLLRPARFLAACIGLGLALRALALSLIPLTINLGDMLPLIGMATGRLLHGENPYIVYQMPWELPLTYWPLTVLSYLPAAVTGLDLRVVNLLYGPLVGALLLWAGGRRGPGAAGVAFGLFYLVPTSLQWDISTAAPPYWLWLCVAFATTLAANRQSPVVSRVPAAPLRDMLRITEGDQPSVVSDGGSGVGGRGSDDSILNSEFRIQNSDWLAGAGAGAALAAAPLAWPFLPFIGLHWLTLGWGTALRRTLVAAGVAALLVGPFLLWDPAGFWNGAVSWFNDLDRLPQLKWDTDKSWLYEIGLAGPFWQAGTQGWLKPLQVAVIGGLVLVALGMRLRPLATPQAALRWGAAAYLLFMVVNPVIWPYLYAPGLLALVFAMVPGPSPVRSQEKTSSAPAR
jgi:hypothetical protein